MKKIFTVLLSLFIVSMSLWAQEIDESFVFMDEEGEIIPNGATVIRNVVESYDEVSDVIYSGISVLNMTGSTDYIQMTYEIQRIDNGTYQICFPSTCNMQTATGTYQTGVGQLMADLQDIQSEWYPVGDGECIVTLTIELFTKQGLFPPSYVHKAFGPSITVQFVKSSSASDYGSPYDKLAEGVYLDGTTLYICSGVTSLGDLQVNPSEIYCYAAIPPACMASTFTGYDAILHVPAAGMVSYFTALYWYNFNNILSDAIEPLSITMNTADAELEIGQQLPLSATVAPGDATPKTVYWSSSDASVATVSADGSVTAVATGECDIIATCVDKVAVCHVTVVNPCVTIILDKHEVCLLPNHTVTLTASCSPIDVDLSVISSNPGVAIPRLVNGSIMVVGVSEGTATITVNAADSNANPDSCVITVYTEPGDVNSDGYVNISDVTNLINYLLSGNLEGLSVDNADTNRDGKVNISDVTTLINYLLSGNWPWEPEEPAEPEIETFTVNGVTFKMVAVDGGTFTMGATAEQGSDANSNENPAHQVTLSSYLIGETEVTQALWQAVMGNNPSEFSSANGYTNNLQRPVEQVSWNDCQTFITKLNQLTGKTFRLPTEAEWEFAARGGTRSQGYKYAGSNTIDDVAWYYDNSYTLGSGSPDYGTHAVATKAPNELGLYDMSGNVWEWSQNWYGSYTSDSQTNPTGPASGSNRVRRGGGWDYYAGSCRVSYRYGHTPSGTNSDLGLRLALDPENSTKFRLSETVMSVLVGGSKSVEILHGNGSYTTSGGDSFVTSTINGNSLTVTGIAEGVSTVYITDTLTGATTLLTVIVKSKETFTVNGVTFTMVAVEGGTFTMGATEEQGNDANDGEKPAHQVTLSGYSIGETEVTQTLWEAVMGSNPSYFTGKPNYPVEMVSWNKCQEFITKLNQITGKQFRLPTEAEWEFAARGGNKSQGYKFAGSNDINEVAWYWDNIPSHFYGTDGCGTQQVATKAPNELGLYDMSGNVWEWCQDWGGSYSNESQTNPTGSSSGTYRIRRGGSWNHDRQTCRVSRRDSSKPSSSDQNIGLRLAL